MAFKDRPGKRVRSILPILAFRPILLVTSRSSVHQLLIAYTVDLIRVLRELFDITLRPELAFATTWNELKEAFEAYERSNSRQRIHKIICSKAMQDDQSLTPDSIGSKVRELLRD